MPRSGAAPGWDSYFQQAIPGRCPARLRTRIQPSTAKACSPADTHRLGADNSLRKPICIAYHCWTIADTSGQSAQAIGTQMNDLDPSQAASVEDLVRCLRQLHLRADRPSFRALEDRTKHAHGLLPGTRLQRVPLRRTTLSEVLQGRLLPGKAILLTFVEACGINLETDRRWEQAWDRLAEHRDQARETATRQLQHQVEELRQRLVAAEQRVMAAEAQAETARAEAEKATTASHASEAALLPDLAPAPSVTTSAPPGTEGAAGPVAERRVCSVLFCDVAGFTPLSESRDPEAVRELLSHYFEVARTVIGRYGGVVEKFIGDAVMAVWGTPVAAEGDAERAVRAGLDLVAEVGELGADGGVPGLAARAGVVTGEVAVTLGAAGEGMVAGDAVNTAARVQAAAQPGEVLADGATQRLAESAIGFADAGEHRLKGKAEPQRLWRATRVLSGVGGVAAGGRAGGAADRAGRGAAHDQGAVPCGGGPAGAAAGAGVRAGRGGQVAAGLGVREVPRRPGGGGVVAPGPVPVLRGRGGVLGAGRDRAAAAGHRRGRPGRNRGGQAGRRAGPVRPRPG